MEYGSELDEVPEPELERSRLLRPIFSCWMKLALGELDPGFVVPNAQIMFSVPTVPLKGIVNANFEPET